VLQDLAEITVEQVLRELAKIGFSDIRKAVVWRNEMVARRKRSSTSAEGDFFRRHARRRQDGWCAGQVGAQREALGL
jgi:hypothetical protein